MLHRSRLAQVAIVAAAVAVFVGAAHFALGNLVENQNRKQLVELNARVIERVERVVDDAVTTLGELADAGAITCAPAALHELHRQVYLRGALKDVRIIDRTGTIACAAFDQAQAFELRSEGANWTFPARNQSIALFQIDNEGSGVLGISWRVDQDTRLVGVVSIDKIPFDVLPEELRDVTEVSVVLGINRVIASFSPLLNSGIPLAGPVSFTKASSRYPLAATLRLPEQDLKDWNTEHWSGVLLIAGLVGLALALPFAKIATAPKSALTELDEAIAKGRIRPYLQPTFSIDTGAIVGCEALARWHRPDGTVVPPSQFIPLAESSGRIVLLTWQIIASTLAELRALMKRDRSFKVSFNVVPEHFCAPDFVPSLRRVVADAHASPRQVVIELTERQAIADLDAAARVTAQLRAHGFHVAIDDAGTGHSGLSHIHKLGVNTLKIDKFFIDSLGKDESARTVVEMLVRLAHEFGMKTIAEGVEAPEQISALSKCGVDEAQGFLVSPPLPVESFLSFVEERQRRATKPQDMPAGREARVA